MTVNVFVTHRCIAECPHCYVNASPDSSETMDAALLSSIVEQAKQAGEKRVTLTGGESVLYWHDLRQIVMKSGLEWAICSNAYWGRTYDKALALCEDFRQCGVRRLELSSDAFHVAYVPFASVVNVAKAASSVGISVAVTACYLKSKEDEIKSLLAVAAGAGLSAESLVLQRVAPFGRAKGMAESCYREPAVNLLAYRCPHAGNVTVYIDGSIYLCCGPVIMSARQSRLYIGSAADGGLIQAIREAQANPTAIALRNGGIGALVGDKHDLVDNMRVADACELCMALLGNKWG